MRLFAAIEQERFKGSQTLVLKNYYTCSGMKIAAFLNTRKPRVNFSNSRTIATVSISNKKQRLRALLSVSELVKFELG